MDLLHRFLEVAGVTCGPFAEMKSQITFFLFGRDDSIDGVASHPFADGCQSCLQFNSAAQMAEIGFIKELQHKMPNVHCNDQGVHIDWLSNGAPDVAVKWVGESLAIISDDVRERLKKT